MRVAGMFTVILHATFHISVATESCETNFRTTGDYVLILCILCKETCLSFGLRYETLLLVARQVVWGQRCNKWKLDTCLKKGEMAW